MPAAILQTDSKTREEPEKFIPERFMNRSSLPRDAKKVQSEAFIPFGGGRLLCPGRHPAFTEIVSFVAMVVYGYDISSPIKKDM